MIAPIYEDPDRLPEGVRTRFRLTMTNPLDFSSRVEDFRQLPDTMIMFLSKLKRITVNIFPPYTAASRTTYSYRYDRTKHLGKLQKVTDSGVDTPRSETVGLFHIAERTVSELPINSTRPSNQADVVLAFPVDDESVPIIKDQHVFAFLPLRKEGFSVGQCLCVFLRRTNFFSFLSSPILSLKQVVKTYTCALAMKPSWTALPKVFATLSSNFAAILHFSTRG